MRACVCMLTVRVPNQLLYAVKPSQGTSITFRRKNVRIILFIFNIFHIAVFHDKFGVIQINGRCPRLAKKYPTRTRKNIKYQ